MCKRVVLINGSPRKKTTYRYLLQMEELFKSLGFATEIINLRDLTITQCSGCECCITKGHCIHTDDMLYVKNVIKAADGIVLASPVYLRSISSILKIFIDRTCDYYHRTELYGKPILSLANTAYSGIKETLRYLEDVTIQWGAVPSGNISRNLKNRDKKITISEIKKFVYYINTSTSGYSPSIKELMGFQVQKILASKIIPLDKIYWQERLWMESDYFFPCKISWGKRFLAKGFFGLLNKKIQPIEEVY